MFSKYIKPYIWELIIFTVAIFLRFIYLDADLPSQFAGSMFIEEGYLHNAKSAALSGQWIVDDFNYIYFSPLFNLLAFGIFKLFGVGFYQARLLTALSGSVSLVLLYWFVRMNLGRKVALYSLILGGLSWVAVGFERQIMIDPVVVTFLLASLILFQKGAKKWWLSVVAGIFFALGLLVKNAAIFFIPVFMVGGLHLFQLLPARRKRFTYTLSFFGGGLLVAVPYIFLFVLPQLDGYMLNNIMAAKGAAYHDGITSIILELPIFLSTNLLFTGTLFLSALLYLHIIFSVDSWPSNPLSLKTFQEMNFATFIALAWLVSAVIFFGILVVEQFPRRFHNFLPPLIIFGSIFLDRFKWGQLKNLKLLLFDSKRHWLGTFSIWLIPFLVINAHLVVAFDKLFGNFLDKLPWALPRTYTENRYGNEFIISFILTGLLFFIVYMLVRRGRLLRARGFLYAFYVGTLLSFLTQPLFLRIMDFVNLDFLQYGVAPGLGKGSLGVVWLALVLLVTVPIILLSDTIGVRRVLRTAGEKLRQVASPGAILVGVFVVYNLSLNLAIFPLTYFIRDTSRELGKIMGNDAVVLGNTAGILCLETGATTIDPRALLHKAQKHQEVYATTINERPFERFRPNYLITYGIRFYGSMPHGPDWELQWYLEDISKANASIEKVKRFVLHPWGEKSPYIFDLYRVTYR